MINVKNKFLLLILALWCTMTMFAQNGQVTGITTDLSDGSAMPGVTIVLKGTGNGTISDIDGKYSIKASDGDVLIFSFIGMQDQEVVVSGKKLDVALETSHIDLEGVVAIGYGVVKKKEVTGAVSQIKAEDIKRHVTSDLATALQGQVAGVNVVASSGQPGSNSNIQIRGVSSISGSNTPLYVVDGIPQDGDPRLSPNEIETIDILKDAASAAVYGTRGSAGVILITTKGGHKGDVKVTVDGTYGIQHITSGTPKMNTNEQLYYYAIRDRNAEPVYPEDIAEKQPHWLLNDNSILDVVQVDNAMTQNYNVNISGGSDNITANAVFGYYNQQGVILNSSFERYNGRISTKYQKDKLSVNSSINFSLEEKQEPGTNLLTHAYKYMPYYPYVDAETTSIDATGGDKTKLDYVLQALKKEDFNTRDRLNANVNLNYKLSDELTFITKLGAGITNNKGREFVPYYTVFSDGVEEVDPTKSYSAMTTDRSTSFSWEGALSYVKRINKDHRIKGLLNYSYEKRTFEEVYGEKQGITNNDIKVINGGTVNATIFSGDNYTSLLLGTLARAQYDYKGRYLFSASVRRDGSSKFAESNRWGWFPSAMVGWNVSDEEFWKPISGVANRFKIRASYGTTGNERINSYLYTGMVEQSIDYAYQQGGTDLLALGAAQQVYPNLDVKWETSAQVNLGFDLGLYKNKLSFTADYYNTNKEDMLFPVKMPASAGSLTGSDALVTLNVGNMTNKGVELATNYRDSFGKLNVGLSATFSKNTNEVTSMSGSTEVIINSNSALISGDQLSTVTAIMLGHEAGAFYLNPTDGVIKTAEELAEYQLLVATAKMGDLRYVDTNEDGYISEADREYSGSGLPDYEIGFNVNLEYKAFDFSMNWYASVGSEIMNGSRASAHSFETSSELVYMWSDVNVDSDIPLFRGDSKEHDNYRGYTDYWLEDGSYLRLRNVTLGYTLPQTVVKKINADKLRFYVTAQNPLTFTGYTGYDPEIGGNATTRGLDKGNYPVSSLYSVGLKLDF